MKYNFLKESRPPEQGIPRRTAVAYSLGMLPSDMLIAPGIGILQGIYAKYFGLDLTAIAWVLLLARVSDAVTDPLIGYLSDRMQARFGTRKPFVLLGGLLVPLTGYFLLSPSPGVTVGYFLFWYMAFFLAWTLFYIPHMSWGSEIVTDYNERARLYSFRAAFVLLGHVTFLALPYLPIFPDNQYTPGVMSLAVWVSAGLMLPSLFWMSRGVPDGKRYQTSSGSQKASLSLALRAVIHNKPLLILLSAALCSGLCIGMLFGLLFIYLDSYLLLGNDIAAFFVVGNLLSFGSVLVWKWLIGKTGKASAWVTSKIMIIVTIIALLALEPGVGSWLPLLIIGVLYFASGCAHVVVPAVLADTVDYGILKFDRDWAGTYFSFYAVLPKLMLGVGPAISLMIAGIYHFAPADTAHSAEAITGLKLGMGAPVVFALLALLFVWLTPITRHRHAVIRKRIEQRQQRLLRKNGSVAGSTGYRFAEQSA